MIRINCTNCKAQLSIDDAFAGGVCRCQYCGTIQTVPKHLKGDAGSGVVAKAASSASNPKALYQNKSRAEGIPSSGLDEIANAIATSSGLSRSALTSSQRLGKSGDLEPPGLDATPPKNRTLQILTISAVAIVLLLGVIIGVLLRGGGSNTPVAPGTPQTSGANPGPGASGATAPPTATAAPMFLGQKLAEPTVIFVLDRGDANREELEYLKIAVVNTLRTFRPDQKFQIVFWKVDSEKDPRVIPKSLSAATADVISATSTALDDVFAFGSTKPQAALSKAFAAKPAALVIASAKPVSDDFSKLVMDARKDSTAKVYCFSLNAPPSRKQMSDLAQKTGGAYREVPLEELKSVR